MDGAAQPLIPIAQHLHKHRVRPRTDDFHERITAFHRQPEGGKEEGYENGLVLPAVQLSLMFPEPDGMAEQRLGITNRPQVARCRAARANQIAEQMEMKGQQAQQQNPWSVLGIEREQN